MIWVKYFIKGYAYIQYSGSQDYNIEVIKIEFF